MELLTHQVWLTLYVQVQRDSEKRLALLKQELHKVYICYSVVFIKYAKGGGMVNVLFGVHCLIYPDSSNLDDISFYCTAI